MKSIFLTSIFLSVSMCATESEVDLTQWEQDKLILPISIVQPELEEANTNDSTLIYIEERKSVSLEQGFLFYENEDFEIDRYKFYSEINVDNPELWNLSKRLIRNFKNEVYLVYHISGDSVIYGEKFSVVSTLKKLDKIESDILNNCSVNIGVVQDSKAFNELFIDESKYLRYWGNNESFFRTIMSEFNIAEKKKMNFVDEYPRTIYDWSYLNEDAMTNEALIDYLKQEP